MGGPIGDKLSPKPGSWLPMLISYVAKNRLFGYVRGFVFVLCVLILLILTKRFDILFAMSVLSS